MTDFEKMQWNRCCELSDQLTIARRALAMVLISPNHQSAVQAVKQAFAQMDRYDPFAPETVTEEAHEGIKVGAA